MEPVTGPRLVLTTVNSLVQRVPPRSLFKGKSISVKSGGTIKPESLAKFLDDSGYNRTDTVMEPGEYAIRGGIFDVFPSGDPTRFAWIFWRYGGKHSPIQRFHAAQHGKGRRIFAPAGVRNSPRCRKHGPFPHRLARNFRPGRCQ